MSLKLLNQNLRKEWLNSRVELSTVDGDIYLPKGEVIQITSPTTEVTCNGLTGRIRTVSQTLASGANAEFSVTNSYVNANSTVIAQITFYSGNYSANGFPVVTVDTVADGYFDVNVMNCHPSNALSGYVDIQFIVTQPL